MSISVIPEFIYGHKVDAGVNDSIPFDEGSGELLATVVQGDYSMSELALAIVTALNAAGANTYTVVVDRATRKHTISADANFDLLALSGSTVGTSIFPTIGFNAVDLTGTDTYEGQNASGTVYRPQYIPQNLLEPRYNKQAVDPSVQESADGSVEVLLYGQNQFLEMEIVNITEDSQPDCSSIEENLNAVNEAIEFLDYLITKANIEYVSDPSDPNTFEVVLLESTEASRKGTDYRLEREFKRGSPQYFTMGKMVFRKVS